MAKLCLGGAFNPIHHGHLLCARAAAEALGLEGVVLIPSRHSPLKASGVDMADADARREMCRLAITDSRGFEIEDCELNRPPPSYTIDTVRHFRQAGWQKVVWLIGSDQVLQLPRWHRPLELLREAHLVIAARPGSAIDWKLLPPDYAFLAERVLAIPTIELSSTDIRRRVAAGEPIDFMTPPAICRYITERGLYRS